MKSPLVPNHPGPFIEGAFSVDHFDVNAFDARRLRVYGAPHLSIAAEGQGLHVTIAIGGNAGTPDFPKARSLYGALVNLAPKTFSLTTWGGPEYRKESPTGAVKCFLGYDSVGNEVLSVCLLSFEAKILTSGTAFATCPALP